MGVEVNQSRREQPAVRFRDDAARVISASESRSVASQTTGAVAFVVMSNDTNVTTPKTGSWSPIAPACINSARPQLDRSFHDSPSRKYLALKPMTTSAPA